MSEKRFWGFCNEMGFTREQGIGHLMCLWLDTQERKIVQASREEIIKLTGGEKILEALVKHEYITQHDLDTFEVRGNRKRVTNIRDQERKEKRKAKSREPGPSVELVAAYQEEYRNKYQAEAPPALAEDRSKLLTLLKNYGREKTIELIRYYFKSPDMFYARNFHPIGLLVSQRHRIYSAMTTGINMTRGKVLKMEKSQAIQQTLIDIEMEVI